MSKKGSIRIFWTTGPRSGQHFGVGPGAALMVGRDPSSDVLYAFDERMSRRHCRIFHDGEKPLVMDLKSTNGTFVNQVRVTGETLLQDGDEIMAGSSVLRVRDEAALTRLETVCEILRSGPGHLYGVFDAARDPDILDILRKNDDPVQSLFEGAKGAELSDVAPYLVQFQSASPLLRSMVYGGWGKAWGIYLQSAKPFAEVRRQLRRSLTVKAEGFEVNQKFYFRFYDPRVFRIWVDECTPEELGQMLGPIESICVESDSGDEVKRISLWQGKVEAPLIPTEAPGPAPAPPVKQAPVTVAWADETRFHRF